VTKRYINCVQKGRERERERERERDKIIAHTETPWITYIREVCRHRHTYTER
jgi:hypothetical protein